MTKEEQQKLFFISLNHRKLQIIYTKPENESSESNSDKKNESSQSNSDSKVCRFKSQQKYAYPSMITELSYDYDRISEVKFRDGKLVIICEKSRKRIKLAKHHEEKTREATALSNLD